MRIPISFLFSSALCLNWANAATNSNQNCKALPDSPDWPSLEQWNALNESISGRLHAPVPAGSVCHEDQPGFSNTSCTLAASQWYDSWSHADSPWSTDYNDETCLPDPAAPCSTAGYPAYIVEALDTADVQAAVNFARETGVRLIVKGTGHDFPGRSSGPGSLSIWTHRIQGLHTTYNDPRAEAYGGVASIKIAAGMKWKDIFKYATVHNLIVIGGADPDVGIGGWILGGGHSPLSSRFGLGADQVLEFEVVTADGEYRVVNENADSDLFWALRGGGGSTYAVLLSVTVKAYPQLPTTVYDFQYNTTADSDTFWSLVAYFHQQLPVLSDSGVMGYYYVNSTPVGMIYGVWIVPEKTGDQVKAIMSPIEKVILSSPSWAKDSIVGGGEITEMDDFLSWYLPHTDSQNVGVAGRLGSWLLDKEALSKPLETLKTHLKNASPAPLNILGHLVAGKGVRDAKIPGGTNSVLPSWRQAYSHVVLPRLWSPLNATDKAAVTTALRNQNEALRELAPNSGAYMSEADPTMSGWQEAYYGDYYPILLELKKKWDPEGVFWCKPCVGHELWEVIGSSSVEKREWGIGQTGGKICRK